MRRRALLAALPVFAAGCVSVGGSPPQAPVWYLLDDPGAGAGPASPPVRLPHVLLLGTVEASSFDESAMLAYGRAPGVRAHYQFAGWTERPGRRIGVLLERRLAARGRFQAVAQATSGVRGDLVLNLALEHLYHDVTDSPGRARVALEAELVGWRGRTLVGRRLFERSAPVARESAGDAVAAIGVALSGVLDELCAWVEASAAGAN